MTASGIPRGHLRDDIQYNKNILINNESAITLSVMSKTPIWPEGERSLSSLQSSNNRKTEIKQFLMQI